jgi:serine/threonine protein phosphatase PrpC
MIYSYGISLPGTYHIKNDIVCQDYHKIIHIGKKMAIAAVADGLGSADYSDVGSKIAATTVTEHCYQCIISAKEGINLLDIIKNVFKAAQRAVEKEAASKDHDIVHYDTTLTLAVLIYDTLYYGHSGDSGMIALTTEGRYETVTKQQRDEEGRVFPLFYEDKWEFGQFNKKVSSVLLATDGMLETFFPLYIKNAPVNIHVSLMQFFMDNRNLRINKTGSETVQANVSEFMENIPDETVNDDKTVAVLINTAVKTKLQPKEYYIEPDWIKLKQEHDEAWKRAAYPGLYKNEKSNLQSEEEAVDPAVTLETAQFTTWSIPTQQQSTANPNVRSSVKSIPLHKSKISWLLLLIILILFILVIVVSLELLFKIPSSLISNDVTEFEENDSKVPITTTEQIPTYKSSTA